MKSPAYSLQPAPYSLAPPTGAETESYDQSATWQPEEIPLGDGRTLVLDDS